MNLAPAATRPTHTYVPATDLPTNLPAPAQVSKLTGDDDNVGPYVGRMRAPGGWNHSLLLIGPGYSAGTDFLAAVAAAAKLSTTPDANKHDYSSATAFAVTQGRDGAFIVAPVDTFDPVGEKEVSLKAADGEQFAAAASSGRPLLAIVDGTRWAQTAAPRGDSAIVTGAGGLAVVVNGSGQVIAAQG